MNEILRNNNLLILYINDVIRDKKFYHIAPSYSTVFNDKGVGWVFIDNLYSSKI